MSEANDRPTLQPEEERVLLPGEKPPIADATKPCAWCMLPKAPIVGDGFCSPQCRNYAKEAAEFLPKKEVTTRQLAIEAFSAAAEAEPGPTSTRAWNIAFDRWDDYIHDQLGRPFTRRQ